MAAIVMSSVFLTVLIVLMCLYAHRSRVMGPVHSLELEKKGSSWLIGRWCLGFVYWVLKPVVKLLVKLKVSPNFISWLSLVLAVLMASQLAIGHFALAGVLAGFAFLLDAVDGMVARMQNTDSLAGATLDTMLDRYTEFLLFLGLAYYYQDQPNYVLLVLLACLGSWMVSYVSAWSRAIRIEAPRGTMRRPERLLILVLGVALSAGLSPMLEPTRSEPTYHHYPLLLALLMVSVFANLTAILRTVSICRKSEGIKSVS